MKKTIYQSGDDSTSMTFEVSAGQSVLINDNIRQNRLPQNKVVFLKRAAIKFPAELIF